MEQGGERPLPHFLAQNFRAILVGVAGVNDQRQSGHARGGDVVAKHPRRRILRRVIVMIIEPRLAESHAFRVARQRDELLRAGLRLVERVIGMRADGAEHVLITLRDRGDGGEFGHMGRDGDHPPDAASLRARDDVACSGAKSGKSRWQWVSMSMGAVYSETAVKGIAAWTRL